MRFTAYQHECIPSKYNDLGELINYLFFEKLKLFYKNEKNYCKPYFTINSNKIKWFDSFKTAYSSIPNNKNRFTIYLSGSFGAIIGLKKEDYLSPDLFSLSDKSCYFYPYLILPNLNTFYTLLESSTLIIRPNQLFFNFVESEDYTGSKILNMEDDLFDKMTGKWIDSNDIDSKYTNANAIFLSTINNIAGGYTSKAKYFYPREPHQLESKLDFGKYKKEDEFVFVKELKLIEIIEKDINYFEWLIINLNHFFLEKDQIERFKNRISDRALLINARKVNEYTAYMNDYDISSNNENSSNCRDYADRESFNAMTDGNYGSYEDIYGID
jgi:hypothetical protein